MDWPTKRERDRRHEAGLCAGCGEPAVKEIMDFGAGPEEIEVFRNHKPGCPLRRSGQQALRDIKRGLSP